VDGVRRPQPPGLEAQPREQGVGLHHLLDRRGDRILLYGGRGLTQRQLGELAGVAHTTVQKLESLSRGAYPQTLRKLASALGVAFEELLHGESTQR
jgi:DNA-binding XRE family transcriptional regulator